MLRQTYLLSRAISAGRNLNSHSYHPLNTFQYGTRSYIVQSLGEHLYYRILWRMGASGPRAMSRVPSVKLPFNLQRFSWALIEGGAISDFDYSFTNITNVRWYNTVYYVRSIYIYNFSSCLTYQKYFNV